MFEAIRNINKNQKLKAFINYIAIAVLMIFYMGTWLSPYFYHITEIYNTLIVFAALAILFINNVPWIQGLRNREIELYLLIAGVGIAFVNLFIVGSHKGCILILADFMMLWYLFVHLKFTRHQIKFMEAGFVIVFLVWTIIDLAFSYNSNTGATVTVFTFLCAVFTLTKLSSGRELYGLLMVVAIVRIVNLVLWHLARGAFVALFLFLFFYYIVPEKLWKNKVFYRGLCLLSTLGSLLFVASYVALAATGVNFQMPFFYKSLFSGREQIWYEVWELLSKQLLTGIGSGFKLKSFFEYNIHNSMYDILAVHGLIVFILAVWLILRRLFDLQKIVIKAEGENLRVKRLALAGIFAIFLESFIDMDLMWANYTPVLLFLLLKLKGYDNE